mmetsp:Transcript_26149/g.59275  ORF Transcript_26149/g.59275 Transcript_26149/m.59275 type:complete len:94 (-) Transcript_26149:73-354(-)|eukprot:766348-Hanusia_phi.AAC.6
MAGRTTWVKGCQPRSEGKETLSDVYTHQRCDVTQSGGGLSFLLAASMHKQVILACAKVRTVKISSPSPPQHHLFPSVSLLFHVYLSDSLSILG